MNEHIAVRNKTQYLQVGLFLSFQTKNEDSDQVIIVAPPHSPQRHDHDLGFTNVGVKCKFGDYLFLMLDCWLEVG